MKPTILLLALGFLAVPATAQEAADGLVDRVLVLETKQKALEKVLASSVVASPEPCASLGEGWVPYEAARSRFLLGEGGAYGSEPGTDGGHASVTLTTNQMPRHRHRFTYRMSNSNGSDDGFKAKERNDDRAGEYAPRLKAGSNSGGRWRADRRRGVEQAGGGNPHDNMPPYLAIYFCNLEN